MISFLPRGVGRMLIYFCVFFFFFFNDTATTEIYTLSLHDALPICYVCECRTVDVAHRYRCNEIDRKSTRLNSSHLVISYAVFCLKKKKRKLAMVPLLEGVAHLVLGLLVVRKSGSHPSTPAHVRNMGPRCPLSLAGFFFFFNDRAPPEIYPLSLPDALPICRAGGRHDCTAERRPPHRHERRRHLP